MMQMSVLRGATPERLNAFSDAVFAVLITVLVLELRPPEEATFKALLQLWPTWLSYAVSYLFIAIVWANHHYLLRYADETTPSLLWFNFAHLFAISLLPLSTAWMAVSRLAPQPVAFYAAVFFLVNATYVALIWELMKTAPIELGASEEPPDHAHPLDHDPVPVRAGRGRRAEISDGRAWNLHLLPDRLSQAGSAGYGNAGCQERLMLIGTAPAAGPDSRVPRSRRPAAVAQTHA